jgi:hypothetical protein
MVRPLGKRASELGLPAPPQRSAQYETINNFVPQKDVIDFNAALFANFAAIMADAKQVGQDTVITHDPNNTITLQGVLLSSLHADDFHFV